MNFKPYLKAAITMLVAYYVVSHYVQPVATVVGIPYVG